MHNKLSFNQLFPTIWYEANESQSKILPCYLLLVLFIQFQNHSMHFRRGCLSREYDHCDCRPCGARLASRGSGLRSQLLVGYK